MDEPSQPELNISRLYRDTAANMTWEGTTNVLASETVRYLVQGGNLSLVGKWVEGVVEGISDEELRAVLEGAWKTLVKELEWSKDDLAALLASGREIMFSFAWIVSGILLCHDAQRDKDPVAMEVAKRWVLDRDVGVGEYVLKDVVHRGEGKKRMSEREKINWDCRIVWVVDLPGDAAVGYRVPTTGVENKVQAKL